MKYLLIIAVIVNVFAHDNGSSSSKSSSRSYRNQLGYCEPLTIDLIASLVTKEARQLLDPWSRAYEQQLKGLRYDLYTRLNPNTPQTLYTGDVATFAASHFNAEWPVRFSIHGWNGKTTTCSSAAIKDAYLSRGNYNIILVDWSDYALDINYIRVVVEIFEVSRQLNEFARFLHNLTGIRYEDMYLIGHSAGCHIAGIAGKLLKPDRYGVIYALDVSGPIHRRLNEEWRLTSNDALYVETIQTDVALLGFASASIGHASFFPNWGLGQPHCPNTTAMEPDFTCDHFGALYYFVESLQNPKAFGAIRCKSFEDMQLQQCSCGPRQRQCAAQAYMGGEPAVRKDGIYYLSTRATAPFGYGDVCKMKRPKVPTISRLNSL